LVLSFSREGVERGKPAKQNVTLRKKKLLESGKGLHSPERKGFERYINNNSDIDVKRVTAQYQDLLQNFYQDFDSRLRELYVTDLKEYKAIEEEIRKVRTELFSTNKRNPVKIASDDKT
jgi:hypothetical protein